MILNPFLVKTFPPGLTEPDAGDDPDPKGERYLLLLSFVLIIFLS
jgi:hypothetical protein